ncbi:MAG: hypothetical protein M3442_07775 [Chloroflexota bacterium]|nr:hypothetical protein [Chloroflexota bacterium]
MAAKTRSALPGTRNADLETQQPALAGWLFLFLLGVYLMTAGGKGYSVDGAFGYEMAKTISLDPQHTYFRRFKTAFARWGVLLPLLGQPFVLAGDALAGRAPERDDLFAGGHRFRVEEWPALGAGGRLSYTPPLPDTGGGLVQGIGVVSFLAHGLEVGQGVEVGKVSLWGGRREITLPVRAGIETAEWAIERPDVVGQAQHARLPAAGHWIGQPRGNLYYAYLALPEPLPVEGWELRATTAGSAPDGLVPVGPAPGGGAQWHVRAVAFQTAGATPAGTAPTGTTLGGTSSVALAVPAANAAEPAARWVDVYTGERFWSPRETRDFFTRLVYSALNAFTTAATAVLVYALSRRFGYGAGTAVVVALGYGLGTMAWPYAKLDFSEPAATLFAMIAVWAFYRAFPPRMNPKGERPALELGDRASSATRQPGRWGLAAAGALLLAMAGKYTAVLFAGAVVGQWALSSRWWTPAGRGDAVRFLGALVLPVVALGGLGVGVAFALTGETPIVLTSGTGRLWEDWLALPLWTGLRGLLLSPGKSLFLYSPWLLLALPGAVLFLRRHGRDGLLVTLFPALILVIYGMKLGWHGGSWGPRYLLPLVPLLTLAAAPAVEWCLSGGRGRGRWGGAALAVLAVISVGVQGLAIGKDPERYPAMVREFVVPALPDQGSLLGGRDYWVARGGPGLGRALQGVGATAGRRGLGYLWGYPDADLSVEVREPQRFTLSLYFVDWDRQGRRQTVTVEDANGTRRWALDRDFGDGLWASWPVAVTPERPLRVSLEQRGRDTAVVSAVTFDSPTAGLPSGSASAPTGGLPSGSASAPPEGPRLDEQTRGDWRGRYGAGGYVLFAWHSFNVDAALLPPYVAGYELRHVGDHPDPRIHVEIAADDVLDTALLYALPFSPLLGNAWLLAADISNLLLPARRDLTLAVLARPPWSWFGVSAPLPPQAEYGLGLDFWPTLLYTNYASHSGVLTAMWTALLGMEALAVAGAAGLFWRLAPQRQRGRRTLLAVATLSLVLAIYNALHVWA